MAQHAGGRHLALVSPDRRERRRDQYRRRILAATDELIAEAGLDGITMQRVADHLDCAVGTLYRYFPSKAALLTALQAQAVDTLAASLATARTRWDAYLGEARLVPALAALVPLVAFGGYWVSASVVFADEFDLQRSLLSRPVAPEAFDQPGDARPLLARVLEQPAALLDAAVDAGALERGPGEERALLWVAALDGVLLVEDLAPVDRHLFRAPHLARQLTADLLAGWGAARADVDVADAHVQRLVALGPLAPLPEGPALD